MHGGEKGKRKALIRRRCGQRKMSRSPLSLRPHAMILVLVGFEGFTLSCATRHRSKATGDQICFGVPLVLSGALRKREAVERSAALTRLS
jgi:hypothetical protein